jgi:ABC-type Fe3+-hydroxamate transport system substrate-binding protein
MLLTAPQLDYIPKRIISLVPSQTELLYDLGLNEETIGITKFCIHPAEWFVSKTRVGGTKSIKKDIIDQLQPDLIIANKEENVKEQVEALAKDYPVWVSDIHTLEDALQMISDVGTLTQKSTKANDIIVGIRNSFNKIKALQPAKNLNEDSKPKTAYLIWRNPYMSIGHDTFIHDMLLRCGLYNIFNSDNRYPEISIEQLQEKGCELLLLSSEPYPFKQQHIAELQVQLPACRIILVNGEMFSWYGSRLLRSPQYFTHLLASL